jgi:hypothetical protein
LEGVPEEVREEVREKLGEADRERVLQVYDLYKFLESRESGGVSGSYKPVSEGNSKSR